MAAGELWVWIEHDGSQPRRVSLEALGKARALGCRATAVILGADTAAVSQTVAPVADRVIVAEHAALVRYDAAAHAALLGQLLEQGRPLALLGGATFNGKELFPRVAARLNCAFMGDCTDLALHDDGTLLARRAVHGGKAYAWLRAAGGGTAVVTTRPNAFDVPQPGDAGAVEAAAELDPPAPGATLVELRGDQSGRPELTESDVVVAAGRGLGNPENFVHVEQLADALDGAVGASRAVVDSGWRSHDDQVGKSGKTVSPKLYFALGISGAIHHVMGMDTAKVVVAINSDPSAPIFKAADYGLVGDINEVVPRMIEGLRKR